MTLNVNEPSDQALVSELPGYIREDRAAINAVSGSGNVGNTELEVTAGATSLTVGIYASALEEGIAVTNSESDIDN